MPQYLALITLGVLLVILLSAARLRRGRERLVSLGEGFTESVASTGLIRYTPTSSFEKTVQGAVKALLKEKRRVLLVSTAPRSEAYAEMFQQPFQTGGLLLVRLSASPRTERFYAVEGSESLGRLKGRMAEISVDWLEYLSEMIEGMPRESALVFEPLSDLVLMNGFEKAYKFLKKTVDHCVTAGIRVIAFINREAHDESVLAGFEGLFTRIADMDAQELRMVK